MLAIVVGSKNKGQMVLDTLFNLEVGISYIDLLENKEISDLRLKTAGIERAQYIVALTDSDKTNFYLCRMSKKIYGVDKAIMVVNNPDNYKSMMNQDIDLVIDPNVYINNIVKTYISEDEIKCMQ